MIIMISIFSFSHRFIWTFEGISKKWNEIWQIGNIITAKRNNNESKLNPKHKNKFKFLFIRLYQITRLIDWMNECRKIIGNINPHSMNWIEWVNCLFIQSVSQSVFLAWKTMTTNNWIDLWNEMNIMDIWLNCNHQQH